MLQIISMLLWFFVWVVLFCLAIYLVPYILLIILFYSRFKIRNLSIKKLALEFHLDFTDSLPSLAKFSFYPMNKDLALNTVKGRVGSHSVELNDIYHTNVFKFWNKDFRQTVIKVDNQRVNGTLKNFTLGSTLYFSSVYELRKYFSNLK